MGTKLTAEQIQARIMAYDIPSMERNIEELWRIASPDTRAAGLSWYGDCSEWVAELATLTGIDYARIVDVTACLSQRNLWDNNRLAVVTMLTAYINHETACPKIDSCIGEVAQRAWEVLHGQRELGGIKVCRFARNIRGESNWATIDVWAITGATNWVHRTVTDDWEYYAAEIAYQNVAAKLGLTTSGLQGATWLQTMLDPRARAIVASGSTRALNARAKMPSAMARLMAAVAMHGKRQ